MNGLTDEQRERLREQIERCVADGAGTLLVGDAVVSIRRDLRGIRLRATRVANALQTQSSSRTLDKSCGVSAIARAIEDSLSSLDVQWGVA